MKVFVSGSKGQLGHDCIGVMGGSAELAGADLPEVDITDHGQCLELLDAFRPDVIVNCAAYTAVDACETDPSCWGINAVVPGVLAEWVEKNQRFLVHVSTDYVFAGNKPLYESLTEKERTDPVSEYGRSKRAGELAIAKKTDRFAILRTAWLYGSHGKNFLKTILRLAIQNPDRPIKVVNDQFGSPTWSHTLARQIQTVAEQQTSGFFHSTSEEYCSWYDLAEAFLDDMNVPHHVIPCSTREYPTAAKRPNNSILENERLKQLGLNLFTDWRSELTSFVAQHGNDLMNEVRKG